MLVSLFTNHRIYGIIIRDVGGLRLQYAGLLLVAMGISISSVLIEILLEFDNQFWKNAMKEVRLMPQIMDILVKLFILTNLTVGSFALANPIATLTHQYISSMSLLYR
jgi:hypothetical protein